MITAHLSNKPEAAITLFGSSEVIQLCEYSYDNYITRSNGSQKKYVRTARPL
jgi:hypothetical protein